MLNAVLRSLEGDLSRFTKDVGDAAEGLLDAVGQYGHTAGSLYDAFGRVTDGVVGMTPEEVALVALLVKRVSDSDEGDGRGGGGGRGRGATPDEVLAMVRRCEEEGKIHHLRHRHLHELRGPGDSGGAGRPGGAGFLGNPEGLEGPEREKGGGSRYSSATVGDLIVPGNVYLLERNSGAPRSGSGSAAAEAGSKVAGIGASERSKYSRKYFERARAWRDGYGGGGGGGGGEGDGGSQEEDVQQGGGVEGGGVEKGGQKGGVQSGGNSDNSSSSSRSERDGYSFNVRRTTPEELSQGGIRLSSRMVDDHSMDLYEPAVVAAAQRYSRL